METATRQLPDRLRPILWETSPAPVDYLAALARMEAEAAAIRDAGAPERLWLLEHPPVITTGTSATPDGLVDAGAVPVIAAGRGGQHTYHGPGQRVVYVLLDLAARGRDVRAFVHGLEAWVIAALARLGVRAFRSDHGTGIWVGEPGAEQKIAAIGVRVRRWVSFHGLAINVTTDLEAYRAIIPCGIRERGVTRLADWRPEAGMAALDEALLATAPGFLDSLSRTRHGLSNDLEAGPPTR